MKHEDPIAKAEKEKMNAKLQEAKARLDGLEATARERKAQADIDAITALKARRDEIHTRIQEFTASNDAKASQVKAELEAKLANLEEEVGRFATRLKAQSTHR